MNIINKNNIKLCPTCSGWGILSGDINDLCKVCNGIGIYIEENNKITQLGFPVYIDFAKRSKNKFFKNFLIIISVFFIFVFFIIIALIIGNNLK